MNDQQHQTEAAGGGSALTSGLGALADQFECHALSRSIDDVEAAGRAMREAKAEIEQLREGTEEATEILDNMIASIKAHGHYSVDSTLLFLRQARQCLQVPNAIELRGGASAPSSD